MTKEMTITELADMVKGRIAGSPAPDLKINGTYADVWIGLGATISDNVNIGNRAKVLLNAVVAYDVAEDELVSGFYTMPHRQWKQVWRKLKEGL